MGIVMFVGIFWFYWRERQFVGEVRGQGRGREQDRILVEGLFFRFFQIQVLIQVMCGYVFCRLYFFQLVLWRRLGQLSCMFRFVLNLRFWLLIIFYYFLFFRVFGFYSQVGWRFLSRVSVNRFFGYDFFQRGLKGKYREGNNLLEIVFMNNMCEKVVWLVVL